MGLVGGDGRHRRPDAEVRTRHLAPDEPRPALLDHRIRVLESGQRRVDAVIARMTFPVDGLDVTALRRVGRE